MKRILAMLCVIACLFALAVPALAAGTVTVHAYVPEGWSDVRLWAWNDSQQNAASGDWPGDLVMTKGADGWYTITIPTGYNNMLVNANGGSVQTDDITGVDTSKDVWIVCGDRSHKVSDSKPSDLTVGGGSSTPAPTVNTLGIVGDGVPGLQAWVVEDAAGDMTNANGVYTKVLAFTAGSTMKFKFAANRSWDYNFGGAEADMVVAAGSTIDMVPGGQDLTLTADKNCNLKFTVTLKDGGASLAIEVTDEEPSTTPSNPGTDVPSGDTYTVYAKVPAEWKTPCIWCWDNNASNPSNQGDWPGSFYMTKGADGWYSVEIPAGYNNVLINANGGAVQTPDITGLSGQDVWINAYTDVTSPVFAYQEITDIVDPPVTEPGAAVTRPTKAVEQDSNDQTAAPAGADNTVLFCIIGSVVVIAVAAVVFIILKKKQA